MVLGNSMFFWIFIGIIIPGTLTIWNIYNCVSEHPKIEKFVSSITVIIGGIFYLGLQCLQFEMAGDWNQTVNSIQYHNSISSEYWGIFWLVVLGLFGYFYLLFSRAEYRTPLGSALAISMLIIMNVFHIAYALQLYKNISGISYLLYVYHANLLLLSARVIHLHMRAQVEIFRNRAVDTEDHRTFLKLLNKIDSLSKYSIFVFVVLFFVVAVIELIFVLLGQGLDAPIKMFTDTADWTFSKQIPPPPADYDGHYLCTVAAGGHRKVVKPLRLGTRRNETIVVNRQLCIANAFEEHIQEKLPRFHRKVRDFYDTYGYPLSRKITSPLRADLIYFMMKPLEWLFLIYLYAFDQRPEQRIARQYAYKGSAKHSNDI